MLLGYARSTENQDLELQRRALEAAGCEEIFEDHGSGLARRQPQFHAALERIQPGNTLVVSRLGCLSHSLGFLVRLFAWLAENNINLRSIAEEVDTATPSGRLVLQIMGALSEFESLLAERGRAGLGVASRRRARVGRPRKLTTDHLAHARGLLDRGETRADVARLLGVHEATVRRALAR